MDENGWENWLKLLIDRFASLETSVKERFTSLDESVKDIQKEIKAITSKLYDEIDKNKEDIKLVQISMEEIKRVKDKINDFKENLEEYKSLKETLNDTLAVIKQDINGLKIKSGIWGGLSGLLTAIGSGIIYILTQTSTK